MWLKGFCPLFYPSYFKVELYVRFFNFYLVNTCWFPRFLTNFAPKLVDSHVWISERKFPKKTVCAIAAPPDFGRSVNPISTGTLCVQMDFMRTFKTTTKCNTINHVWSHFYKILVVWKYHRRLWVNIFDTDISRCINIYIKVAVSYTHLTLPTIYSV